MKDYVAQFKMAMLEVYYLDEFVAMLDLKRRLHPSRLTYFMDKTPPKSYSEILAHMEYIDVNEEAFIQHEADKKFRNNKAREEPGKAQYSKPNSSHR